MVAPSAKAELDSVITASPVCAGGGAGLAQATTPIRPRDSIASRTVILKNTDFI
jgi:hypothetical protein